MTKKLQASKKANDLVSNMILISGTARTGTTILGKLINSAKEVEYAYDPPMLFALFPLINKISKSEWKMIFETYCYEELMLGYIAGRNLNFNINDDSCIFHVKPKKIIETRLKTAFRKIQLVNEVNRCILSIKMVNTTPFLPEFQSYYPGARIVIIVRRANDVLNSMLKKNWFDDLSINSPDGFQPYRVYKSCRIPYWMKFEDAAWWCRANSAKRAAYCYLHLMEPLDYIPNKILISYHDLISKPEATIRNLFDKLSLTYTSKTTEIVSTVAPTKAERHDVIDLLPKLMQKKISALEEKYLC